MLNNIHLALLLPFPVKAVHPNNLTFRISSSWHFCVYMCVNVCERVCVNHVSHVSIWMYFLIVVACWSATCQCNFALIVCREELFLSQLSTDREIIHCREYILLHSNLQLCMLFGEHILTHCVPLHSPPLNYTRVVPFSQGLDMINTSISQQIKSHQGQIYSSLFTEPQTHLPSKFLKIWAYIYIYVYIYNILQHLTLHQSWE